jgi:hypothetical protein
MVIKIVIISYPVANGLNSGPVDVLRPLEVDEDLFSLLNNFFVFATEAAIK